MLFDRLWAKAGVAGLLIALLLLAMTIGLLSGSQTLGLSEVWRGFSPTADTHLHRVVIELRMPRVLLGLLAGAHFALAGWILQAVTRNPLADPGVLGVSAGASLGAVIALVFGGASGILSAQTGGMDMSLHTMLPWAASAGGLAAAGLVCALGMGSGFAAMSRIVLIGAITAGVLQALSTGVLASWGHAQTESAVQWLAGSLYGASWQDVSILLPWTLVGVVGACVLSVRLKVLQLSDDQVQLLGVSLGLWRVISIAVAALLAATATALTGPVGFVGLLVPHFAGYVGRWFAFSPALLNAILGSILVVTADAGGRVLFAPLDMPVGVMSGALGVPFFLYLLAKRP